MIFKNLFRKKKWLSEKVSERLAAVAEINIDENGNKAVLHELAFNDGDEKVRRATLEKLNDFSLWWQAHKKDNSDVIRRLAEKTMIDSLTGKNDIELEASLKQKFVEECNKTQLLEQIVFQLDNETLTLNTLNRLNRDALTQKAIVDSDLSEQSKLTLLDSINDKNQLKKLTKKVSGNLLSFIEEKLAQIQLDAEKPIKLEKQSKLVLAQLNALKDKQDYSLISQKRDEIGEQWNELVLQFDILTDELKAELQDKFESIDASLQRIVEPLKMAWQEQKDKAEAEVQAQTNYQNVLAELVKIEAEVTTAVAEDKEIDQTKITSQINHVSQQCNTLSLLPEHKVELVKRAESLFNRASQVPQIKQAIEQARNLLTELSVIELPSDMASLNQFFPKYKEHKKAWNNNIKNIEISLPADIEGRFIELCEKWDEATDSLISEQRQLFSQTKRKLSELEGLIRFGKFHNAFGLYKKLSFWIKELNAYQQEQISRKWQKLQEEVSKLQELEKSFSNPKKQELLEDIKKIAEEPLTDLNEQAHRVRMLRSNWQSLGHAGDEEEEALNNQFDGFCETAFAPCREHYKQLENDRNANLEAKNLILEQLNTVVQNLETAEVSNWRELESVFVKLTRLWRETGLIDREKVSEMNKRYQQVTSPIKQAINQHHKDNENQKLQLLTEAEGIVAQDISIQDKSEQLKNLQGKWQKIGFAGKNQDQKLWNAFRAINGPVFEQRDQAKAIQQKENMEQFDKFTAQFAELTDKVAEYDDIASIRGLIDEAESLFSDVKGLNKQHYEKLRRLSSSLINNCEQKISELRLAQEKQIYVDLFDVVIALSNGQSADTASLKPAWQTAIANNNKQDRDLITIKLEISAGIESPAEVKAQRNEIQMKMLSEKLEQGFEQNTQELLEVWLGAGVFSSNDIGLLERIKPIFTK